MRTATGSLKPADTVFQHLHTRKEQRIFVLVGSENYDFAEFTSVPRDTRAFPHTKKGGLDLGLTRPNLPAVPLPSTCEAIAVAAGLLIVAVRACLPLL